MIDILNKIVTNKRAEVNERSSLIPIALLEKSLFFNTQPVSLNKYINRSDKSGIIAEYKNQSPSKGIINDTVTIEKVSVGYMQAGASALSILTDSKFFGGNNDNLIKARKLNFCPILRKDFIISEYQIIEAKSIGADAILLIASILTKEEINKFTLLANTLGMEVLFEVHNANELDKYYHKIDIIGVNNRNLRTFETSLDNSYKVGKLIPENITKVSESGIESAEDIIKLKQHGFSGFLMGETFMRNQNPAQACASFINSIKKIQSNVS